MSAYESAAHPFKRRQWALLRRQIAKAECLEMAHGRRAQAFWQFPTPRKEGMP